MRIDEIGLGNLKLIQDPDEFCYGTDAVLLSRFVNEEPGKKIIDLCTGNGAIALMLDYYIKPSKITGIDINAHEIDLAKKTAKLNELTDHMDFLCEDVLNVQDRFDYESFDVVTVNPPYQVRGTGVSGVNDAKQAARFETSAELNDFFKAAYYLLKPKGNLYMVHRPSRLVDILSMGRQNKLEAKRMQMVAPYPKSAANIVLIQFVKNGGKQLTIMPEYYVHESNNY